MDRAGGHEVIMEAIWTGIAVAARYGHQPLSEILALDCDRLRSLNDALYRLIERESKTPNANGMNTGGG